MTFKRKTLLGIVLFLLAASGAFLFRLYRQPLGPALELPTSTASHPTRMTAPLQVALSKETTQTKTPPTAAEQTATPQPLCGGPDLSQFHGKFNEITNQFARGQMPQARGSLDSFERSLGDRPSSGGGLPGGGGGLPGGGGPGGGVKPRR